MRKHYSLWLKAANISQCCPGQSARSLSLSPFGPARALGQAHYKLTYVCASVCAQRGVRVWVCVGGAHQFMVGHVWIANEKLMGTQSKCCLSFGTTPSLSSPPLFFFLPLSVLMCVPWERVRSLACALQISVIKVKKNKIKYRNLNDSALKAY